MAKRKSRQTSTRRAGGRKRPATRASGKRPKAVAKARKAAKKRAARGSARSTGTSRKTAKPVGKSRGTGQAIQPAKVPRLDRQRRTLDDAIPTPPSSLNMNRKGSAARSGREEMEDDLRRHGSITPGITGGDVDADFEQAYFSGDEAPGGDNPTPDQDVVEDIGRALGVEYQDNEELKSSDKLAERDKHRWELDPASSEDYKDRD